MNKPELLNVLLAVAVVFLTVKVVFFGQKNTSDAGVASEAVSVSAQQTAIENIMMRTSIRAYEDRQVEDEKVEALLRAAMAAPTAGNKQPWKFVVVKDRQKLKAISEHYKAMSMAENAPLAIVVCGDMNLTFPGEGAGYWVQDASAATQNLLLAAHAMGLGAVWCGVYPVQERVNYVQALLDLPEDIMPLNVVPVGYPAEDPAPKDKWNPDNVRYDTWE